MVGILEGVNEYDIVSMCMGRKFDWWTEAQLNIYPPHFLKRDTRETSLKVLDYLLPVTEVVS